MIPSIAKKRIGEVIRIDTVTSSQADFMATHVPIKEIQIKKKWGGKTEKSLSEEDVFNDYIINTKGNHQFIIVIGSSGAGKSHLIRWFSARLKKTASEDEVVLFVRRSDNSLKGTIKQLLELPEVANIPNKSVYDRLVRATATIDNKKLKDMIYQNFIVEIKNDESDEILSNNEKRRLIALLQDDLFQAHLMREDGAIERIYQKVAENQDLDNRDVIALFDEKDFTVDYDFCDSLIANESSKNAKKMASVLLAEEEMAVQVSNYMNTLVNKVIQLCAGLEPGDFEQVFIEIRKEIKKQGKNLTLLIEDITAFTGVNVALLNVLTTEHTGMYEEQELCRISSIVGTTEKYFNVNFMDNHKDRVTCFFHIPNDVFGENENSLYEFVGRYLNAMSLNSAELENWVDNGAVLHEYPVHSSIEKADWDTVEISDGKALSLFPFTKKAIFNLYKCILQPDYRTPRYLLRDVVERVVRNYLYKSETFPEFQIENINNAPLKSWDIVDYVRNNVPENEVERVIRFIRIWGDGSADTYVDPNNNVEYIGGLQKGQYDDLNIPCFKGIPIGEKPIVHDNPQKKDEPNKSKEKEKKTETQPEIPAVDPALEKFLVGQKMLDAWIAGGTLNIGKTTKDVVNLTKARDEINKRFLISAINWQIEGVSLDNLKKVQVSIKSFIGFERQKLDAEGALIILPADRETYGLLEAFLAFVTIGNNSWNFENSAMMVYRVHRWLEKWKPRIIAEINTFNNYNVDYQECAIALEIIREIMQGVYVDKELTNIPIGNLIAKNIKQLKANSHCSEWNTVLSMLCNNQEVVKSTITQYFNIIQGTQKASQVFVQHSKLNEATQKVINNRLFLEEDLLVVNDPIKQRRDFRETLDKIVKRLSKVCDAEKELAKSTLNKLGNFIDYVSLDEEDIDELIYKTKDFYEAANKAMVNIHCKQEQIDALKKNAKDVIVAVNDVMRGIELEDTLDVMMCFSTDPLNKIRILVEMLVNLNKDINYANTDVLSRKEKIKDVNGTDITTKYNGLRSSLINSKDIVVKWGAK